MQNAHRGSVTRSGVLFLSVVNTQLGDGAATRLCTHVINTGQTSLCQKYIPPQYKTDIYRPLGGGGVEGLSGDIGATVKQRDADTETLMPTRRTARCVALISSGVPIN